MLKTSLADLSIESVSHEPGIKKKVFVRKGQMGNITQISLVTFLPGQVASIHRHQDMWETFIVQMGKGTIEVNQELIFIEAGDCVVVSPGESHEVKNTGVKEMKVLVIGEEI